MPTKVQCIGHELCGVQGNIFVQQGLANEGCCIFERPHRVIWLKLAIRRGSFIGRRSRIKGGYIAILIAIT